jgi:PAS domain S-box-containing protein
MNVARVIVICFNITSSLPTFTVDQSLIVCEWNASLSKCTGLEAKEVINKPVLELIHVTHSSMLEKVSHVHSGLAKDR